MYTIRQVIESAFRVSGVKGVGDTPDSTEASDALDMLNGILDNFGLDPMWKAGTITRTVTPKSDGSIIIANDLTRIITYINSTSPTATITTAGNHGLPLGTSITIKGTNLFDGVHTISAITSLTSFQVASTVNGTSMGGTFKKTSESDDYLIDLVIDPPDVIDNVISVTGTGGYQQLNEYTNNQFYTSPQTFNGWYFETSRDPYPTLYVSSTVSSAQIIMKQPGYRNVNFNTNTDQYPQGMREAIKWRLAADLAAFNGYLEMSNQCLLRFTEILAKYKRSHRQTQDIMTDTSAPGYVGGHYNIYNDSIG